jgi:hypothetical protein
MKPFSSSGSSSISASGSSSSGSVLLGKIHPTSDTLEESGGTPLGETIQESGGEPITGESGGPPITGDQVLFEAGGVPIPFVPQGNAVLGNLQFVQPARLAGIDAAQVLRDAAATLEARGKRYDTNGTLSKERSMPDIVARFEAATGIKMTTAQGYQFMVCLKEERIARDPKGYDNYVDRMAYLALQLEAGQSPVA